MPADFAGKIKTPHITLDLYPRVEALSTIDKGTVSDKGEARYSGKLNARAMAMFDWDQIFSVRAAVQTSQELEQSASRPEATDRFLRRAG